MTTWVVVADNSRARIFSAEKPAAPLTEVRDLTHPAARLHEGDLVTDSKAGRDRNSGTGSHRIDREDGIKHEEAERFAGEVCDLLESARAAGEFRKLYVVAAPSFLGLLRKQQSNPLKLTIAGEVDKNLTLRDPGSIREHLPDFL